MLWMASSPARLIGQDCMQVPFAEQFPLWGTPVDSFRESGANALLALRK